MAVQTVAASKQHSFLSWFCIQEDILFVIWALCFSAVSPQAGCKMDPPVDLHGGRRAETIHNKPKEGMHAVPAWTEATLTFALNFPQN